MVHSYCSRSTKFSTKFSSVDVVERVMCAAGEQVLKLY
jgi:hypothetical protein